MGGRSRRIRLELVLTVGLFVGLYAALAASQTPGAPPPGGPIAGPPVTPPRLTDAQPRDPYRQVVPGLLARTRLRAEKAGPYAVEIWDVTVGPGQTSGKTRLPGAAVIEVRSGRGTLQAAGKARELAGGGSAAIDDGDELTIANADQEAALILRATVIRRAAK